MSSEVSTVADDQSVEALRGELAEVREQQAATAEILASISSSVTDANQVFSKIAASAARLCDAYDATIMHVDGKDLRIVAHHGPIPPGGTLRLTRAIVTGCAVLDRQTIHVADLHAEPDKYPEGSNLARLFGHRTILAVPLIHAGEAIGVIAIRRTEVRQFTDRQIDLLKTFADQAVIAIENARLFEEVQNRTLDLQESLEYQTAIADVLAAISKFPNQLQPVFDAIAETSRRLCHADRAAIVRLNGGVFSVVARAGSGNPTSLRAAADASTIPISRASVMGRAVLEGRAIHIEDIRADPEYSLFREVPGDDRRTMLGVPLISHGMVIGVINLVHTVVHPFTARQIALVETFADQAVIAIENARLFEAEQTRTRELTESLEYQTATSEVLSVISHSPDQLQPVLDVITETAVRLCRATHGHVRLLREDGAYHIAAHQIPDAELLQLMRENPFRPGMDSVAGRVALQGVTVHVADVGTDPLVSGFQRRISDKVKTAMGVPLKQGGRVVGIISVWHTHVQPFTERQIKLVETFADQAVIAINNVGLFKEVQARTAELAEALEQQTATSKVLQVISSSPRELQPVFGAMLANATRVCHANFGIMWLWEGEKFRFVALHNAPPALLEARTREPVVTAHPHTPMGRVARTKQAAHIYDITTEQAYLDGYRPLVDLAEFGGARTVLAVPMLKDAELVGVIGIYRQEVRPFAEKQIELVKNFAAQAVIAIENTRLFEELQARNRDLTALSEVGRAVSSTLDLKVVLKTIVDRAVALSSTDGGSIFYHRQDRETFELGEATGLEAELFTKFRQLNISRETGLGEAIAKQRPLQFADIADRASNPLRDTALEAGLRAALVVPLLGGEEPLGTLVLWRRTPGEFPQAVVTLMQAFADQSVIALENARLFNEIAQKSRELEIASQHKSQFVANMSHELRTPLAAILGYAELMHEGFYEPQGPKSLDALTRIRSNGKHLLGLINTVLDIAKIESGQFTLNMAEYAVESVVETVRSATESLAQNKKLALKTEVAGSLPIGLGDEQRLTQVLLNLVGNAIKFTDVGVVRVTAKAVNGHFAISVADTGPGIPAQEQTRIFDEFHQVDASLTKAKGGTGLGLAIAKQIVEMHGGRIWVESTLGKGSTFQMELPTRAEFRKLVP
jgi:GAF domain-containing protein/anti-sigma regulatory factor (Ser/Thr protein kinase)